MFSENMRGHRGYRPLSVSEIVYGIRLPRLVAQKKLDKTLMEQDIGETLENALTQLLQRAQIRMTGSVDAPAPKDDTLMAEFVVDPELVKQNNLLKGILILPHPVESNMTVLVFAKVTLCKMLYA